MSGDLPCGVRSIDIDKAAPGYYDEPFYCVNSRCHCAQVGLTQCELCEWEAHQHEEPKDDGRDKPD